MSFAVICKSCQARFLLNDDLLRRRVAGRVVTVRCRQCHATIEVDASDLDPQSLPEAAPAPAAPKATTKLMFKSPRPAPTPPRPPAKSTLMGIGAPRPAGSTELVALSAGFLGMNESPATPTEVSAQGFPEPPPPPAVAAAAAVDVADWDLVTPPPKAPVEAAPESVDDFLEELPPSEPPPIEEELPSSTGTPSLKALAHHEHHDAKPRVDDFIANMSAAMNGGLMPSVPTIDVSHLTAEPVTSSAPSIDMSDFELPAPGAQTLALFAEPELEAKAAEAPKAAPGRPAPPRSAAASSAAAAAAAGPVASDPPPLELQGRPEAPRERKAAASAAAASPPASVAAPRRSGLAAPLLLALAAAAAFLIWRRGAAPEAEPALEAQHPAPTSPAKAEVPVESAPAAGPTPEASAAASAAPDDVTFEVTPAKPAPVAARHVDSSTGAPAPAEPPASSPAIVTEEPKAEAKPEPEGPSEPAGPFDRAAASSALNASAGQASACRREGDPSGVASVVVTFAPSGRVTSANISGPPFAGTPTGGCIASALRRTRIPAFEGDRVTVSKTVVIQ